MDSCSSSDVNLMKSGDEFARRSQSLKSGTGSREPYERNAVVSRSKGGVWTMRISRQSLQIPPK